MEYRLYPNLLFQLSFPLLVSSVPFLLNLDDLEAHSFVLVVVDFVDYEVVQLDYFFLFWGSGIFDILQGHFFNDDLIQMGSGIYNFVKWFHKWAIHVYFARSLFFTFYFVWRYIKHKLSFCIRDLFFDQVNFGGRLSFHIFNFFTFGIVFWLRFGRVHLFDN